MLSDNFEDIIGLKMKLTKRENTRLLIDTGAQLSFLKYSSVSNKKQIEERFSIKFRGIIGCIKSCTLGTIDSGIYINDVFCPHEFRIVHDYIGMGTAEGILGSDFLRKHESIINYGKGELKIIRPELVKQINETFENKKKE